ncbi:MAG TPA: right-handed parallel beta-helix repeat-containing protein, partial [Stellaceae bacterium]|nr:right-handed parallel beta-helix repeat-containing protein [Stellaceae bacterium]
MNRLWTTLSVLAIASAIAVPSLAEMTVHLKDGRSFTLPVDPQDIDTLSFGPSGAGGPSAAALPPALPAPAPGKAASKLVVPVPGIAPPAGAPTTASLASPPPALLAPGSAQPKASGRVVHVGASRDIKSVKDAAAQAKDGDTIEIDAGTYTGDVAIWRANDLTIRGVGGRPHFAADGEAAEGKAIFVTNGRNIRIENIEFSDAKVGDNNGAGIRAEGPNLTVYNCYFH